MVDNKKFMVVIKLTIIFSETIEKMHSPKEEGHAEQELALRLKKEAATRLGSY